MDRIDIHIEVSSLKYKEIADLRPGEPSCEIKKRVEAARKIQKQRFQDETIYFNSHMNHRQIKKYCNLTEAAKELLKMAMENMNFSGRAYDKILKIARTVADMDNSETIQEQHISEAIQYRNLDRNFWF